MVTTMTATIQATEKPVAPDRRIDRALTELLAVERRGPGLFIVHTESGTEYAVEIVAEARLATRSRPDIQQHRLCLVEPTVTAYAGPEEGSEA